MRSVTVRLDDLRTMILNLGFVGENEHRKFNFDCKKMFGEYPSASVSLTVQPPAGDCYPATVERNGDLVSWTVTDSDLIEEGCGEIQLTFMVGEVVAKTCIGRTKVERSLGATGDIPTPIENWIEQAEEVISEAEAATAAAEGAAEHQPIIDDNGYWAVWDADAEEYVATEYKAQGTDGHDGVGIVSIEKTGTSGLVDTYTITFTSGNPVTYTVTNGRDADPAELIDDTAGAGDTDKVWSADKSHSLLTEIQSKADTTVTDALQKDKAPIIIDSAEDNPIVLTDGADGLPIEGMKIHFLPVQDLHGYDSPWPAGGGKNKLNIEESVMESSGYNRYFPISLVAGTYTITVFSTFGNGFGSAIDLVDDNKTNNIIIAGPYAFGQTAGAHFTFTLTEEEANAVAYLLMRVNGNGITFADIEAGKLQIEPGSTTTSYAPYSNICPITGWTGAKVTRTGKNLGYLTADNMVTHQRDSIAYTNNGVTVTSTDTYGRAGFSIPVKAGQLYTVSYKGKKTGSAYALQFNNVNMFDCNYNVNTLTETLTSYSFTFTANTDVLFVGFYPNATGTSITVEDFQLELGSTATAYEPYQGETYDISFPSEAGTVYGGTLDVTSGVLTVDRAKVTYDGDGSENWIAYTQFEGYLIFEPALKYGVRQNGFSNMLKDSKAATSGQKNCMWLGVNTQYVYVIGVYETMGSTVADFRNYLAENNLEIVYPLNTPITYTLTASQIRTLLGQNNIWSDANGTIELDYRADTKLFIAKQKTDIRATIAPVEDGATASKAYSAGKLFYHNGDLCKAKTSIASGATFTLNTNYEITTVADELFALN